VIDRTTHHEQALRFDWACNWVESFGIKLNPARVATYRRDLGDLANHVEAGTGPQFEKERGLENLINSVVEAQELIEIYAGLKSREDGTWGICCASILAVLRFGIKRHHEHLWRGTQVFISGLQPLQRSAMCR